MIRIQKATLKDAKLLSELSVKSFLPAHGHSAPVKDIQTYIKANFTEQNYLEELSANNHNYYLCFKEDIIAGYSKVIFDEFCPNIQQKRTTYLSRIYLLEEFYGQGLGKEILEFNLNLCKKNYQEGVWLKVWKENHKAIRFYKKMNFKIVGESGFKISETHSNPNHHMYLAL